MIKSELVLRLRARNPHLYQRDIEKIVDAILQQITRALAQGDRVELRGFGAFFFHEAVQGTQRAQSSIRCSGVRACEGTTVFQDR